MLNRKIEFIRQITKLDFVERTINPQRRQNLRHKRSFNTVWRRESWNSEDIKGEKLVMLCDDWWPCRSSSCVGQSSGKSSTMQDADTWYKLLLKWLWWNFALYGQKVVRRRGETFSVRHYFMLVSRLQSQAFQIKTVLYSTFTIQWSSIGLLASIINGVCSTLFCIEFKMDWSNLLLLSYL